jgi:DNA polymerase elongation subunit (family B)
MSDKLHEMVSLIKQQALDLGRTPSKFEFIERNGNEHFLKSFKYSKLIDAAGLDHLTQSAYKGELKEVDKPKILLLDIETAPIQAYVWRLFDENVGLNQIVKDWHLLSWSAKWLGERKIFYQDQRKEKDVSEDFNLCAGIWQLINEADIIIGHNSDRFDLKKLNARFISHQMKPPSQYRTIDTLKIARKMFGFTSNKLEFIAGKLCGTKKLTDRKFNGFALWDECLKGNQKAWQEMEKYNKRDVVVLEELYLKLQAWDKSINFSVFNNGLNTCRCGSTEMKRNGYTYTNAGKFRRYQCTVCGAQFKDKSNMIKPKDIMSTI